MGKNKHKKNKDLTSEVSEKVKELCSAIDRLFSMVPNPDWLTK